MVAVNRFSAAWLVTGAAAMLACGTFGCASHRHACSPLIDKTAQLAPGVILPEGFYPLAGQYAPDNEEDQYTQGWPRYIVCETDGMILAYVPAQTLMMGGGEDLDEVPARTVHIDHFYMDIHEVTNKQFDRYFRKGKHDKEARSERPGYGEYWVRGCNDHHPVRSVSWHEAADYAEWVHRALPTEAQWEAAARGDDRRVYPWGNEEQSDVTRYLCNASTGRQNYDGYEHTAPVENYAAGVSPFGIFNMAGNVWEWCADWYDPGRYAYPSEEDPATELARGAKPFGDRNYPNPVDKDRRDARVGPLVGAERVIRGGSFTEPIQKCRVYTRAPAAPGVHQHNVGFRCILPLPPAVLAQGG